MAQIVVPESLLELEYKKFMITDCQVGSFSYDGSNNLTFARYIKGSTSLTLSMSYDGSNNMTFLSRSLYIPSTAGY